MQLVIITGLSGSGKSQVIKTMEDIGYYAVDNMPTVLIKNFVKLCYETPSITKAAVVVDIRAGELFKGLLSVISEIEEEGYDYDLLFLDSADEVLIKRYKETRRRHPLSSRQRIISAIESERKLLAEIRDMATYIIDTSNISNKELKERISALYLDSQRKRRMFINVLSFGFKYGIPLDADLVFDARFLPNPFYLPKLKQKTGMTKEVQEYVLSSPQALIFKEKLEDMISFVIPYYIEEGKLQCVIAIGCTGGKHRSVTFAEKMYEFLNDKDLNVELYHRDISRE